MSDVMLNGYIYHETNSAEAQEKIALADSLGGNLSTTIDGNPAWVFDGVAYIRGNAVPGHHPIDWSLIGSADCSDSGSSCECFTDSDSCTHGA